MPTLDPGPSATTPTQAADPYGPLVAQALAGLNPSTQNPLQAARLLVNQLIGAQNKAAQVAYQNQVKQAQADAARAAGIYQGAALAQKQLGSPQAVQGAYNQAATQTADFAKGYSDAMRGTLGQTAAKSNTDLSFLGAPSGQQIGPGQADAAGNVLYALGGAIPAQTLTQQGASAYGSLAAIPSSTIGLGAMYAAGGLSKAQREARDALRLQQAQIAAQRPQDLAQFAGVFDTINSRKQAAAANRASLLLGAQQAGLNLGYKQQSAQLAADKFAYQINQNDVRTRNTLAKLYGADPITGKLTLDARKAIVAQQKAAGYTPAQRAKYARQAASMAGQAWNGYYTLPGADEPLTQAQLIQLTRQYKVNNIADLDSQGVVEKFGLSYQEALRKMLANGIPLVTAQRALNSYWTKPGRGPHDPAGQGRPTVPYQLRVVKKRK